MTKTINEVAENNEEIVTNAIEINEIDSLCQAIENEDIDKIEFLLTKESIINYVSSCNDIGLNILHRAVFDGKTKVFKSLIKIDGLVDKLTYDDNRLHLIHIAAITGSLEIINYLLDHDQGLVNFLDENGLTPMWYSLIFKRDAALYELSKRGGVLNYTGDVIRKVKGSDAIVIDTNDSSVDSTIGLSSLDIAIIKNDVGFVKRYLEYKELKDCNPDNNLSDVLFDHHDFRKNSLDISPLHLAFIYCRLEIALLLINSGNYINNFDRSLDGDLHYLIRSGIRKKNDLINCLLDKGIDINWRNSKGQTALHFVIRFCYNNEVLETLSILLERKANPNLADNEGQKPLHYSIRYLNGQILFNVMKILLEYNANPDVKVNFSRILLDIAFNYLKRGDLLEVIKFISGFNVDEMDQNEYYFITRYATVKDTLALFYILKGWDLLKIYGSIGNLDLKNLLLSNNSEQLAFYNDVNQSAKVTSDVDNYQVPVGCVKQWPNPNDFSNVVSENDRFSFDQKEGVNQKLLQIIDQIDNSIGKCYECVSELLPRLQKIKNIYRLVKESPGDLNIAMDFLKLCDNFYAHLQSHRGKNDQLIKDVKSIVLKIKVFIWSYKVIDKKAISISYIEILNKSVSDLGKFIDRISHLRSDNSILAMRDYAKNLLNEAKNSSKNKENVYFGANKGAINNTKWLLNKRVSYNDSSGSSSVKPKYEIDQAKVEALRRISR